ncbi:amidohydrolase family protein [Trichloromonas sp.]|uniref:amidohydrolase family protein n=1 Tax=Trichloromonas sp. TaxID=3069249 RepID=UPI003D814591
MIYIQALLLTLVLSLAACAEPKFDEARIIQPTRSQSPVIDMHAHIAGIGAGGSNCYVSPDLRNNWRYDIYLKAFGLTQKDLEEHGDQLAFEKASQRLAVSQQVDGAVILALDGVVNQAGELDLERTEVYIPNDFVSRETAKYDNLFFGASINPYRKDALQRLEQVKADGAVLIKWLPAIQQIDPSDLRLTPFYSKLIELELPLLVHTGAERSFSRANDDLGDPMLLRLPLELGVTVIAAHVATTGKTDSESNFERLVGLFPEYPNLYADISSLTQLNKLWYLPKVLDHPEIHDRLLYGTDFPLGETSLFGVRLVSPWYFPFRLGWARLRHIARIENPWDRDLELKKALGFGPEIFTRPAKLLKIK